MPYSTIKKKKCKCGCDKYPTLSCFGWNYSCLPQDLKEKAGTKAKVAQKNKNKRVALGRKLHIAQKEANGDTEKSTLWFLSKRYQCTGFCVCGCHESSCMEFEAYWKFSIAHVLQKSKFKSIAWHPDNWVELSYFNGCHTVLDNMGYDYCKKTKPILWKIIVEKFKILYPFIAKEELKHIPNVLLETLLNPTISEVG